MNKRSLTKILNLPKYIKGEEIKSPKELKDGDRVFIFDSLGKSQFESLPIFFKYTSIGTEFRVEFYPTINDHPEKDYIDVIYYNEDSKWWRKEADNTMLTRIFYKAINLEN